MHRGFVPRGVPLSTSEASRPGRTPLFRFGWRPAALLGFQVPRSFALVAGGWAFPLRRAHLPFAASVHHDRFRRRIGRQKHLISEFGRSRMERFDFWASTPAYDPPACSHHQTSDPASDFDPLAGLRTRPVACTRRHAAAEPSVPGALFKDPYPLMGFRRLFPCVTWRCSHRPTSTCPVEQAFAPAALSGVAGPSAF